MEQERTPQQDEQAEVEGHRVAFRGEGQDAGNEERVALEPAERAAFRSGEAEDGPEVEGHRAYFGPERAFFGPDKQ